MRSTVLFILFCLSVFIINFLAWVVFGWGMVLGYWLGPVAIIPLLFVLAIYFGSLVGIYKIFKHFITFLNLGLFVLIFILSVIVVCLFANYSTRKQYQSAVLDMTEQKQRQSKLQQAAEESTASNIDFGLKKANYAGLYELTVSYNISLKKEFDDVDLQKHFADPQRWWEVAQIDYLVNSQRLTGLDDLVLGCDYRGKSETATKINPNVYGVKAHLSFFGENCKMDNFGIIVNKSFQIVSSSGKTVGSTVVKGFSKGI